MNPCSVERLEKRMLFGKRTCQFVTLISPWLRGCGFEVLQDVPREMLFKGANQLVKGGFYEMV